MSSLSAEVLAASFHACALNTTALPCRVSVRGRTCVSVQHGGFYLLVADSESQNFSKQLR